MGGKSKKVTVGYKYYSGQHHVMCHGPIDYFSRILVDDRLAWVGVEDGGQINITADDLFGGESREGGISGLVDIEMGRTTQGQNSYLVSQLGADVPAYRGVAGAVLRGCYMGNNPYLKAWAYRGSRVHVRQRGIAQWYDAKAEIASTSGLLDGPWEYQILPFHNDPGHQNVSIPTTGWDQSANMPFDDSKWLYPTPPGWPAPANRSVIWVRKTVEGVNAGLQVELRADNGCLLFINGEFVGASNIDNDNIGSNDQFPVYFTVPQTGDLEIVAKAYTEGPGGSQAGNTLSIRITDTADMNPAHLIRECLTDPDWGMGYADADIDAASFTAAADQLYLEGLGMSLLWDRQTTLEDFVGEVVKHIDGALYVSRVTGKFVLKLMRADYDPNALLTLNPSNISKITNPKTPAFSELTNTVTAVFWEAATGKNGSITVQDPALIIMQGRAIATTVQYPGFSNSRNGSIAAQRDLRSLSFPLFSCTVYANRDAKDLNIGDVFKLTWPLWKIENMVMRISAIAFGDGKSSQVRITCVQDVFSTPTIAINQSSGGAWVDPSRPPSNTAETMAVEAPYFELVQVNGEGSTNSDIAGNPDLGYVLGAASKPTSAISGRIWTDSGDGYNDTGGFDFAPYAELSAAVTNEKTTVFSITAMQDLDQVTLGTWAQIGTELVRVDAINTGTGQLTVGRGVLDTVPVRHAAGERIFFWDEFSGYDPTEYVIGESIDVKLQPISGAGVVTLGDISAETVTIVGRANKPYAPGDLKINGDSYLDNVYDGLLTVTWVDRDRLQQTGGTLADHFDGGIGPEAGTTYRMRTYIDNVLVDEQDAIAGNSATVTPPYDGDVRIEVSAKRDDIYSYQAATHVFSYTGAGGVMMVEDANDYRVTEDDDFRGTED